MIGPDHELVTELRVAELHAEAIIALLHKADALLQEETYAEEEAQIGYELDMEAKDFNMWIQSIIAQLKKH